MLNQVQMVRTGESQVWFLVAHMGVTSARRGTAPRALWKRRIR
jgi:hypothetical protein